MSREPRTRKEIRLKNYDYSQPGYYFVTICTQVRYENILCEIMPVGGAALLWFLHSSNQPNHSRQNCKKIYSQYKSGLQQPSKNRLLYDYARPHSFHCATVFSGKRAAKGGGPYSRITQRHQYPERTFYQSNRVFDLAAWLLRPHYPQRRRFTVNSCIHSKQSTQMDFR